MSAGVELEVECGEVVFRAVRAWPEKPNVMMLARKAANPEVWVVVGMASADRLVAQVAERVAGQPNAVSRLGKACALIGECWEQIAQPEGAYANMGYFSDLDAELLDDVEEREMWALRRWVTGSDPLRVVRALKLVNGAVIRSFEGPADEEDVS